MRRSLCCLWMSVAGAGCAPAADRGSTGGGGRSPEPYDPEPGEGAPWGAAAGDRDDDILIWATDSSPEAFAEDVPLDAAVRSRVQANWEGGPEGHLVIDLIPVDGPREYVEGEEVWVRDDSCEREGWTCYDAAFYPAAPLAPGQEYTAGVGSRDLAFFWLWSFTTAAATDTGR